MDLACLRKYTSCKVCTISEWNMDVFLQVHELALSQGYEPAAVAKWLNMEIEKSNAISAETDQHEFVTRQQVAVHFTKHVPGSESAKSRIKQAIDPKRADGPFDPVVGRKIQELVDNAHAVGVSDLDDFRRFHSTLAKMERRFHDLDRMFENEAGTPEMPAKDLVMAYKGFGDSVGRMLGESIKLRQQERLMHSAVTSTLDTFSIAALQGILKSIEKAMADLRPMMKEPSKADLIVAELREAIADSMSASARTALEHLKTIVKVA